MNGDQRHAAAGGAGPAQPPPAFVEAMQHFHAERYAAAEASIRRFLAAHPDQPDGLCLLGILAARLGRNAEAAALLARVVAVRPALTEAHAELGDALLAMARFGEAEAAYRRALALKPRWAEAYASLGQALFGQGKVNNAITAYQGAIAIRPDFAEAYASLGALFVGLDRSAEAADYYRRALRADPNLLSALEGLIPLKMRQCDWNGLEAETERLFAHARAGEVEVRPYLALTASPSPEFQLFATRRWAAARFGAIKPRFRHTAPPPPRERIRLGYLSSDFRDHATAYITAEVFERHDRARFETFAYSTGPDDGSALRKRIAASFDHFVDLERSSDAEAADRIHADGIDVLVDLQGYTRGYRTGILACRPAPVQVNWLAFPGTMGVDFIDAILVDRFIAPPDHQRFFSERLVHLPHCYFSSDTRRAVAEAAPTRAQCGLPESGFIFCSFNNSNKFTPHVFNIWMRILAAVPESTLWLLGDETVKRNLTREAKTRGIDPARLVFAPRVPPPDHLARHRHADLFLDTWPYNAHTTAADALWMGLPLITCPGESFPARVAGSMLSTIGLPELITRSEAEYEALAIRLATDPGLLATCRRRLADNRPDSLLFDMATFTRGLEKAYEDLWDGHRRQADG